ncbi:MAG: hypothetical protein ACRBCJ_08480 [Hyphomicrobiaceae bacterium]
MAFTIICFGCLTDTTQQAAAQSQNVQNFIAVAGSPAEHSAAIQNGIDNAGAGAVIYFPPGIYRFAKPIQLKSFQIYRGSRSAILTPASGNSAPIFQIHDSTSITISGLNFHGGGIHLTGTNQAIRIIGNVFKDIIDPNATFGSETAIFVAGPTSQSVIQSNKFNRIGLRGGRPGAKNGAALLAFHLADTAISGNEFKDVYQAISLIFEARPGTGNKISVTGNRITNAFRMGIEAQGPGTRAARFEANTVVMHHTGDEDIGLSIVLKSATSTMVKSNKVVRLASVPKSCTGMGIEVAGIGTRVEHNDIRGPWCSAIGISSKNGEYSEVVGNKICGHRGPYDVISFYEGRGRSTSERNSVVRHCR